jgi:hypothetical protein
MKKTVIDKYLENYAEENVKKCPEFDKRWEQVIVIPAHNEYNELLDVLTENLPGLIQNKSVLVILVINGSEDSSEKVHETNLKLLSFLNEKINLQLSETITFGTFLNYDLLVVNRAVKDKLFNKKSGVGLARKIGADIALSLYNKGNILSGWIRCTDADVFLPSDYLEINPVHKKYSAITYPFYHDHLQENEMGHALQLYEAYLRYYFLGLVKAGSPYAFHTVGSSMAVSVEAYAQVRGFPGKREAAEDFYMLNKLAKISPVFRATSATIKIKGRTSDRVPFGTGASMFKISALLQSGGEYTIYHPEIFNLLKKVYNILDIFAENPIIEDLEKNLDYTEQELIKILEKLDFTNALKNTATLSNKHEIIKRHLHTWFDGFRTLKFIRLLSIEYLKPLPWQEAIEKSDFINLKCNLKENIEIIRKELYEIEMVVSKNYNVNILTI